MDKGAGVAKQSRWYYDHEDGVCKVREMLFYQESYNFNFLMFTFTKFLSVLLCLRGHLTRLNFPRSGLIQEVLVETFGTGLQHFLLTILVLLMGL